MNVEMPQPPSTTAARTTPADAADAAVGSRTGTPERDASLDVARVFKALGDPTRLAIFELVRATADPAEGHSARDLGNTVSQIASRFDISLSTVSHHLKELRAAGLIRCERRGQSIYCSVDPATLGRLGDYLARR